MAVNKVTKISNKIQIHQAIAEYLNQGVEFYIIFFFFLITYQFLKCGCLFYEKALRPYLQSYLALMLSFIPFPAIQYAFSIS